MSLSDKNAKLYMINNCYYALCNGHTYYETDEMK